MNIYKYLDAKAITTIAELTNNQPLSKRFEIQAILIK